VEDEIHGDILWDNIEESDKGASSSGNESATEGSFD
jgi:hypothetical protein